MYKRIIAPVDGSKMSECALEHVIQMAEGKKAPELILFHVLEEIMHPYGPLFGESELSRSTPDDADSNYRYEREKTESHAKEYLSQLAENLTKEGLSIKTEISRGEPAEEILKYAMLHEADLIVMSTHGRSGVTRWAFGSVADRVIRNSTIPVLIAVPKGCRIK